MCASPAYWQNICYDIAKERGAKITAAAAAAEVAEVAAAEVVVEIAEAGGAAESTLGIGYVRQQRGLHSTRLCPQLPVCVSVCGYIG